MSQVRNRRTNEVYARDLINVTRVPSASFFRNIPSDSDEFITRFLRDFSSRFPREMSLQQKREVLSQVREICLTHKARIQEFIDHPERMQQLLTNPERTRALAAQADPSFIRLMGGLLLSAQLNAVLPGATIILSLLPAAAASMGWTVHSGQPEGGADLCSGITFGCIQGYLTNGTEPWTTNMPQFNRRVDQTGSGDYSLPDREQLRTCMNLEKVGNTVASIAGEGKPGGACFAKSTPWNNLVVTSQVNNLPQGQCFPYKDAFEAESNGCASGAGSLLKAGEIAGIVIGSVAGLVLIAAGVYGACYLAKRCYEKKYEFSDDHSVEMRSTPV